MLVPLGAGLGYAVAVRMLKRGGDGAGPWRVTFVVNRVIAVLFGNTERTRGRSVMLRRLAVRCCCFQRSFCSPGGELARREKRR
jgi:hypothetical protein